MTASYQLIDYSLRPAKFAERKMLCDMFSCLKVFGSLESYRYVGFGSIWFSDCILFHRTLGIEQIISIEKEYTHEACFTFNNPYRGIELRMGTAAEVLPGLEWNHRSIVWLDYDDPLSPSILDDTRTVATRASPGTALIISVQTQKLSDQPKVHGEQLEITTRDQYKNLFKDARTPTELEPADLRGWRLSRTSRCAIRQEIENGVMQVNVSRAAGQHLEFRQVVAFEYADGAKMTTIGGVFVDRGQKGLFEGAGFRELSFFRDGNEALRIKVPLLTPHEMRYLDRSLPCHDKNAIDLGPIPESDATSYAALYRYLPNFASYEP